jgi:hypothetical protein
MIILGLSYSITPLSHFRGNKLRLKIAEWSLLLYPKQEAPL